MADHIHSVELTEDGQTMTIMLTDDIIFRMQEERKLHPGKWDNKDLSLFRYCAKALMDEINAAD